MFKDEYTQKELFVNILTIVFIYVVRKYLMLGKNSVCDNITDYANLALNSQVNNNLRSLFSLRDPHVDISM